MKFGRFHGIALCVLGLLLLFAQGVILVIHSKPLEQDQPVQSEDQNENPWPLIGGIGLISLLAGGVLIATQPKKTLPEELATDRSGHVHREEIRETTVKR